MNQTIILNNSMEMPLLGLGGYRIGEQDAPAAVETAVSSGYRLLDTAPVYKNEEYIGRAVSRCKIPRGKLFITSKVWNNAQRLGDVEGALERTLERLRLSYLDLFLIHWPVPGCYLNTWEAMMKLQEKGYVRSIGVSNFNSHQLKEIKESFGIYPAVNQMEVHPLCYPRHLIEFCQSNGIAVQAYAPLGRGAYLDHDVLCVMGIKYAKTPAQIGLRWAVQKGIAVIPKSKNKEHIRTNARIFDFSIDPEDMALLDKLNEDYHTASIPEDLQDVITYADLTR